MAMTWTETEAVFPVLRELAIKQGTCFCKCGCRAEGVSPVTRFGKVEPGICATCTKSRSQYLHERATGAAYIFREAEDVKAPKVAPTPVTAEERRAAFAYVTGYGDDPTPLVERLLGKLESHRTLTDAEVRTALRSKEADARYADRVMARVASRRVRLPKRANASPRIHIPKTLPAGFYAISDGLSGWVMLRVDRPKRGPRRGWVIVSAAADLNLHEIGAQRPVGFLNALTGTVPCYAGKLPRALAMLMSNPTKAAADYKQLMKEAG